jgi:flagellar biosynthesis regulator FlbT
MSLGLFQMNPNTWNETTTTTTCWIIFFIMQAMLENGARIKKRISMFATGGCVFEKVFQKGAIISKSNRVWE